MCTFYFIFCSLSFFLFFFFPVFPSFFLCHLCISMSKIGFIINMLSQKITTLKMSLIKQKNCTLQCQHIKTSVSKQNNCTFQHIQSHCSKQKFAHSSTLKKYSLNNRVGQCNTLKIISVNKRAHSNTKDKSCTFQQRTLSCCIRFRRL